jgi:hypothetical protein
MASVLFKPNHGARNKTLLRLIAALFLGGMGLVQLNVYTIVRKDEVDVPVSTEHKVARLIPHHGPFLNSNERLWLSDLDALQNAATVEEKRQRYWNSSCMDTNTNSVDWFVPPAKNDERPIPSTTAIKPCRFTFLDLGANVGD